MYAVVEYLAGGSLRDLFDRGRYLDPSQALVVGLEACRGLDFAHRKGLVHTELTPSKLVFGDDRRLRIVDFGLARLLGDRRLGASRRRSPPTSPATARPSRRSAQPIDGKTDVYSLALILVEAVTGTVPFAARSTVATLSARVGRLMPVSADLGPLASVLERAGRPEPADRSTAAELGRGLVRAAEKLPRPTPIPIARHRPRSTTTRARCAGPNDPTGGIARPADAPAARRRRRAASAAATTTSAPRRQRRRRPSRRPDGGHAAAGDGRRPAAAATAVTAADGDRRAVRRRRRPHDRRAGRAGPPESTAGGGHRRAARRRPAEAPPPVADPPTSDAGDRRRPALRRRWLAWLVGLLVVVALGGLGYLAYRLFQVPTHEVPELVGLDEAAATRPDRGLQLGDRRRAASAATSSPTPARSSAPRRRPASSWPRASRSSSSSARARSSARCRTLAGLTHAEAETALAELQLVALPATEQFDEDVAGRDR